MAKVKFKGRTTAEIENLDIENGSLIYNIENGKTYLDYDDERIPTGGGAGAVVSDTPPENPEENDLWVDTNDEEHLAEVDDEVSTTSTNAVQNQAITNYVNDLNTYSTDETVVGTWIDGKPIYRKIITGLAFTPKPAGETYTNSYLTVVEQLIDIKMTRSGSSTAAAVCSANHPQNSNTMDIFAITAFSNCDTLILEYTKTTD